MSSLPTAETAPEPEDRSRSTLPAGPDDSMAEPLANDSAGESPPRRDDLPLEAVGESDSGLGPGRSKPAASPSVNQETLAKSPPRPLEGRERPDMGSEDADGAPAELPQATLNRIADLVLPPPGVEGPCRDFRLATGFSTDYRVFLIGGKHRTGRFSCAVWLGMQLLAGHRREGARGGVFVAPESSIRGASLHGLLQQAAKLESGSVYVVRDVFRRGLGPDSLVQEYLDAAHKRLEERNLYLVLTGDRPLPREPSRLQMLNTGDPSEAGFSDVFDVAYIGQVIENHILHYTSQKDSAYAVGIDDDLAEQIRELENNSEACLRERLRTPVHVGTFFQRLSRNGLQQLENETVADALLRLARDVNPADSAEVKEWFRELHLNAKLFALLVRAFAGLEPYVLHDLYAHVVNTLRGEGVELYDVRQDGIEELYRQARVIEGSDGLEFSNELIAAEVDLQIQDYHQMLWSATATVCEWIERFRQPEMWWLRRALGRGIGRIGLHHWNKLAGTLCQLAESDRNYIAVVPGYALAAVIEQGGPGENPKRLGEVVSLLRQWCDSSNVRLIWAATAAIWRIYDPLAERAQGPRPERGPLGGAESVAKEGAGDVEATEQELAASNVDPDADGNPSRLALQGLHGLLGTVAVHVATLDIELQVRGGGRGGDARKRICDFLYDGLVRALVELFRDRPENAVKLLCDWMGGGHATEHESHISETAGEAEAADDDDSHSDISDDREGVNVDDHETGRVAAGKEQPEQLEQADETSEDKPGDDGDANDNEQDEAEAEAEDEAEDEADEPVVTLQEVVAWSKQQLRAMALVHFGVVTAQELLDQYRDAEHLDNRIHGPLLQLVMPLLHLSASDLEEGDAFESQYGTAQHAIDKLMEIMREWLENERWTNRVYKVLLQALNRSRLGPRSRLCRHLVNDWLTASVSRTRRVAETLLARAQIIDGDPVDIAGGGMGYLAIDANDAVRLNNTKPLFQLYERLRSKTDLAVGYMGQARWFATPGKEVGQGAFRIDRSAPRLVMPLLERAKSEKAHYALLLTWGPIFDLADALDDAFAAWRDRLVGDTAFQRVPEAGDPYGRFQVLNQYKSERSRKRILDLVDVFLARSLSQRSASAWEEIIRPHLPAEVSSDPAAIVEHLQRLTEELDETPRRDSKLDVARVIGCGIQWLAALDMQAAVDLLARWMRAGPEAPQPPLGCSYALMLVRIFSGWPLPPVSSASPEHPERRARLRLPTPEESADGGDDEPPVQLPPAPPLPAVETHGPLLRLAPLFAEHQHGHGVSAVLEWVRRWVHDPRWAERFSRPGGELFELVERAPAEWRGWFIDRFQKWSRPQKYLGETTAPRAAADLGQSLLVHLLNGEEKRLPRELADDVSLVVLLLSTDSPRAEDRARLSAIACRLAKRYRKSKEYSHVRVVTYRLGQTAPVALPDEIPTPQMVLPLELPRRIGLAAPILESLPQQQVSAVVLLGSRLPLDADDFLDPWSRQGRFYCDIRHAPATEISWPIVPRGKNVKAAVENIFRQLKPSLIGANDDEA